MAWFTRPRWLQRRTSPRAARARTDSRRSRPHIEELEGRWVPSTVTNLADAGPGSLRQALLDTPAGGTVDFQAGLSGTISLTGGELAIAKDLTITGPGAEALTVSGNHASRVFNIAAVANVALSGLTIARGFLAGPGVQGGGIYNAGTLAIADSTIRDNNLTSVYEVDGGGIYNAGTLTVASSTLSGNSAGSYSGFGAGIYNAGTLTVASSTLSGNSGTGGSGIENAGALTATGTTFNGNFASSGGGGIDNYGTGTVTVTDCTFSGNTANYSRGGGIDTGGTGTVTVTGSAFSGNQSAGLGGGIDYHGSGTLTVTASTFSSNTAYYGGGGGIASWNGGRVIVTASTFRGNSARMGMGGAIFASDPTRGGTVSVTASTLSGNSATDGGGIANGGMLTVTASAFSGNSAVTGGGGGIFNGGCCFPNKTVTVMDSTFNSNSAASSGGGIYSNGVSVALIVIDSTLSGNSASGTSALDGGGGIYSDDTGPVTVTDSTLSSNSAAGSGGGIFNGGFSGALALHNTIAAGNHAGDGPDLSGSVTSLGHNLVGDSHGASGFADTDLLDADPRLGPLQDNGGRTPTMALLPGSPAIAAGDPAGAADTDQRGPGFARVVQGRLDIGAFEVQSAATVTTTADSGPGSLRQAILDSNAAPGPNTIAFAIAAGGAPVITPASALPAITQPVAIDATTQPGYGGTPLVVLSGGRAGAGADGLIIAAGRTTVRGLVINGFGGRGIILRGAGNQVLGCYLGTDATGTLALGNSYGVDVTGAGNTVGGNARGAGNLIAGNLYDGVYLEAASAGNRVEGNRIGTDASGRSPLANEYGVLVSGDRNTIGGNARGAGNLIAGNLLDGVALFGRHNWVQGNFIGTDVTGRRQHRRRPRPPCRQPDRLQRPRRRPRGPGQRQRHPAQCHLRQRPPGHRAARRRQPRPGGPRAQRRRGRRAGADGARRPNGYAGDHLRAAVLQQPGGRPGGGAALPGVRGGDDRRRRAGGLHGEPGGAGGGGAVRDGHGHRPGPRHLGVLGARRGDGRGRARRGQSREPAGAGRERGRGRQVARRSGCLPGLGRPSVGQGRGVPPGRREAWRRGGAGGGGAHRAAGRCRKRLGTAGLVHPAARPASPTPGIPRGGRSPRRGYWRSMGLMPDGLPLLIGQELAVHGDDDAVALRVLLLADVQLEVDGAHDAVAEHLVDDGLEGRPVDLGDLVKAIDERVHGDRLADRALGRDLLEGRRHLGAEAQGRNGLPGFFRGHGGLAQ